MAFDPIYKMSIQDKAGNYYSATLQGDGTWIVAPSVAIAYISVLPKGWDETAITWERDSSYMGVFRSQTDKNYNFSKDARAIIKNFRNTGGIQAYATLNIYLYNNDGTAITYPIYYTSQLDFTTYEDDMMSYLLSISTLDSNIYRVLHAYGDTAFNIPIYLNTNPDTSTPPVWVPNGTVNYVVHDGIKLLYSSTFVGASSPLAAGTGSAGPIEYQVNGFLWAGGWGSGGYNSGAIKGNFTLPALVPFNIVQANGTTTFIGNDILHPQIPQNAQSDWLNVFQFTGVDNCNCYSRTNYLLKNALVTSQSFTINVQISASFIPTNRGGSAFTNPNIINENGGNNAFLGFVMLAINPSDLPDQILAGDNVFGDSIIAIQGLGSSAIPSSSQLIDFIPLNAGNNDLTLLPKFTTTPGKGGNPNTSVWASRTTVMTFLPNKVYVLAMVFDGTIPGSEPFDNVFENGGLFASNHCFFTLTNLQVTISSLYNNGTAPPVPAPMLNPSVFPTMPLSNLLSLIVPYMDTVDTTLQGFPIPIDTPNVGVSTFLSDPTVLVKDCCPAQIQMTSAYCMHDLQGNPYITLSFNQLFDFCKKVLGCGCSIEYDSTGAATILRIENLGYYFNSAVKILDLGSNITDFKITQLTDGLGCNLKIGYTVADTNSDFGVDAVATELFFNTPLSNIPGVMDYEEDTILVEDYAIEKIRAQVTNQPIGTPYIPANPSSSNQPIALYCLPSPTLSLPQGGSPFYNITPYDPSNNKIAVTAFQLVQYNGVNLPVAQSIDNTATIGPYIFGKYYPETAINIPLSPCRALQRDTGRYLHSVLDLMEGQKLPFRNTGVIQYNNSVVGLSGIESNLVIGSGAANVTTEFQSIEISNLPPQLFKPIIFNFKSTYPVNMYSILNSNPNGYVSFNVKNENGFGFTTYKGFIMKATQSVATQMATEFVLWATPDTVI